MGVREEKEISDVVFEGFLYKEGEKNKSWNNRYFVLTKSKVLYFTRKDGELKGSFQLVNSTISTCHTKDKSNCFQIDTPKRTYYFSAETFSDMEKWIDMVMLQGVQKIEKLISNSDIVKEGALLVEIGKDWKSGYIIFSKNKELFHFNQKGGLFLRSMSTEKSVIEDLPNVHISAFRILNSKEEMMVFVANSSKQKSEWISTLEKFECFYFIEKVSADGAKASIILHAI